MKKQYQSDKKSNKKLKNGLLLLSYCCWLWLLPYLNIYLKDQSIILVHIQIKIYESSEFDNFMMCKIEIRFVYIYFWLMVILVMG
jgi:hypothetical protein